MRKIKGATDKEPLKMIHVNVAIIYDMAGIIATVKYFRIP